MRRLWPRRRLAPEEISADAPKEDSLLAFSSEEDAPAISPTAAQTHAGRTWPRFAGSRIALAVLGVIVATQALFIAVWLQSGRPATAPETGSITISSDPPGAAVAVDGESQGATPLQLSLPPGDHQITLGNGTEAHSRQITVARGRDATLHFELQKSTSPAAPIVATGTLHINTDPAGGRVSVDGQVRGIAPVTVRDLAPGTHRVTVDGPAGTLRQTAIVRQGAVSSLMIAANSQHASGWLAITSRIPLQVYEGGTLIGSTDAPRIMLSAARHDLELVSAALNFRARRRVQIAAGKTTSVNLDLPNGTLHINAWPWAEVFVGASVLGETPLANVKLPIGSHELVFRHPDLGEHRKTVVVRAGSPVRVGIDLRKPQP